MEVRGHILGGEKKGRVLIVLVTQLKENLCAFSRGCCSPSLSVYNFVRLEVIRISDLPLSLFMKRDQKIWESSRALHHSLEIIYLESLHFSGQLMGKARAEIQKRSVKSSDSSTPMTWKDFHTIPP